MRETTTHVCPLGHRRMFFSGDALEIPISVVERKSGSRNMKPRLTPEKKLSGFLLSFFVS